MRIIKTALAFLMSCALGSPALAQSVLEQVHQDFSRDPGWEGFNNRVVAENPTPSGVCKALLIFGNLWWMSTKH